MYFAQQLYGYKKFADLHTHTTFSDGTFTPAELVDYASKQDISVLAVTDHDSVSGIDEAISAGAAKGVEIIPGIELNTDIKDTDLHILGYYIDYKKPEFITRLNGIKAARVERMRQMVEKLNEIGFTCINLDDIYEEYRKVNQDVSSGEVSLGRPHLARAMVRKNIVEDEKAAFDRYIGNGKPCYVEVLHKMLPVDAVRFIREFNGIPVIAHPGLSKRDDLMPDLVKAGLCGIEVFHSSHDKNQVAYYEKMAADYNLIMTGGSDCHGPKNNSHPLCGCIKLPLFRVEELKALKNKI